MGQKKRIELACDMNSLYKQCTAFLIGVLAPFLSFLDLARADDLKSSSRPADDMIELDLSRFTSNPWTIPAGFIMLESAYSISSRREEGKTFDSHTFPELLLRVGIDQNSELQLGWRGYTLADDFDGYLKAVNDTTVGYKQRLIEEDQEGLFDASAIFELGIPSGARRSSSRKLEPGLGLLWLKGLGSAWELSGNTNISYLQGEHKAYTNVSSSLALDLAYLENWSTYLEYYVSTPLSSVPEKDKHYISSGITYLVRHNFELDLWIGAGLNSTADDFIAGAGFAYLINWMN